MSLKPFSDHFGTVSRGYAASRPTYPSALFSWLADVSVDRSCAWDVATGNGQAAVDLAAHFEFVVGSDASSAQLENAGRRPNVRYVRSRAERSGLANGCASVVTIAQAFHWFDIDAFNAEVRRVLRPGGVVAAWTYGVLSADSDELSSLIADFHHDVIGPYWPPERAHVDDGYASLDFPFTRLEVPKFTMEADWTLDQLLDYFSSWSATVRYKQALNADPIDVIVDDLALHWGDHERTRTLAWPLTVLAGRV